MKDSELYFPKEGIIDDEYSYFQSKVKDESLTQSDILNDFTNETNHNDYFRNKLYYEDEDTITLFSIVSSSIIPVKRKKPFFKTEKKGNRGPKTQNIRKVKHSRTSFDNIQTKLQVHFFSFIINVSNDALLAFFNEENADNFKEIDYSLKRNANHKTFEKLKNSSIKKVLEMNISGKYTKHKSCHNKQLLYKLYDPSNWLGKFFDMNYLQLFNYYYNNQKELNKINFEGKEIIINKKKTKSFYDLLNKESQIKNELINAATSVYYYEFNNYFFCS